MNANPGKRRPALPALALVLVAGMALALFILVTPAGALVPLPDYNEPNDSFPEATALVNGVTNWGAITAQNDKDYFYLDLAGPRQVTVEFTSGTPYRQCTLAFKVAGGDTVANLAWEKLYDDDGSFHAAGTVGPGRFFAIVSIGTAQVDTVAYTVTVTASGGGGTSFPDVAAGSDYYSAITYLAGEGVVSGYKNGNFGPGDPVTRQQFAKMIMRAAGYWVSPDAACPFLDVDPSTPGHYLDPNDPLYPDHYVAVAANHGITVGQTPTLFRPTGKITLAQVVTMVVRTAEDKGLWDSPPASFVPPFADFGEPHYPYARRGAAHGLFAGYPGMWSWTSPASRGQCAFFVWKLMLALEGSGG